MSVFYIKRNDTSPSIQYTLDPEVNLAGATVLFKMTARVGGAVKVAAGACTIVTANPGTVRYDWVATDTDDEGNYFAEFEVTYADGTIETFPNAGYLGVTIHPDL